MNECKVGESVTDRMKTLLLDNELQTQDPLYQKIILAMGAALDTAIAIARPHVAALLQLGVIMLSYALVLNKFSSNLSTAYPCEEREKIDGTAQQTLEYAERCRQEAM